MIALWAALTTDWQPPTGGCFLLCAVLAVVLIVAVVARVVFLFIALFKAASLKISPWGVTYTAKGSGQPEPTQSVQPRVKPSGGKKTGAKSTEPVTRARLAEAPSPQKPRKPKANPAATKPKG